MCKWWSWYRNGLFRWWIVQSKLVTPKNRKTSQVTRWGLRKARKVHGSASWECDREQHILELNRLLYAKSSTCFQFQFLLIDWLSRWLNIDFIQNAFSNGNDRERNFSREHHSAGRFNAHYQSVSVFWSFRTISSASLSLYGRPWTLIMNENHI